MESFDNYKNSNDIINYNHCNYNKIHLNIIHNEYYRSLEISKIYINNLLVHTYININLNLEYNEKKIKSVNEICTFEKLYK